MVKGLGLRVEGLRLRVWGLGLGVGPREPLPVVTPPPHFIARQRLHLDQMIYGLGFRVYGVGFRV